MQGLAADADRWDLVTCCHWLITTVGPELLAAQADAARDLLDGRVELTPTTDCLGRAVQEARFDGFSLLVP